MARVIDLPVNIPIVARGQEAARAAIASVGSALGDTHTKASRMGSAMSALGSLAGRVPGPMGDVAQAGLSAASAFEVARSASLALNTSLSALLLNPLTLAFAAVAAAASFATLKFLEVQRATEELRRAEQDVIETSKQRQRAMDDDATKSQQAFIDADALRLGYAALAEAQADGVEAAMALAASHANVATALRAAKELASEASAELKQMRETQAALAAGGIESEDAALAMNASIREQELLVASLESATVTLTQRQSDNTAAVQRAAKAEANAALLLSQRAAATRELAAAEESMMLVRSRMIAQGNSGISDADVAADVQLRLDTEAELERLQGIIDRARAMRTEREIRDIERIMSSMSQLATLANNVGSIIGEAWGQIISGAQTADQAVGSAVKHIAIAIIQAATSIIVAQMLAAAADQFKAHAETEGIYGLIGGAIAIAAVGGIMASLLAQIPTAHEGAIIPGPASREHLMMVRGQEAVIPLDTPAGRSALGGRGGGITIVINQSVPTSAAEAARAARRGIIPAIRRAALAGV